MQLDAGEWKVLLDWCVVASQAEVGAGILVVVTVNVPMSKENTF